MRSIRIGVLASGRGSNFRAILQQIKAGACNADVAVLITNNAEAPAIQFAKQNDVPVEIVLRKEHKNREDMDNHIKEILDSYEVELVVLAGYMLIIKGKSLLTEYQNRIINIHPSLLPSFPGGYAQQEAFEYGVKISGVTIHIVDETLDAGPILYQEAVYIGNCKTADEVAKKILEAEHKAYAKVINSFSRGKYEIHGRRAIFKEY